MALLTVTINSTKETASLVTKQVFLLSVSKNGMSIQIQVSLEWEANNLLKER